MVVTRVRTYSRADWQRAQALWGDFSPEWDDARRMAAQRGILFPPAGTKWDSWEDDSPSQRAMLIRAIRESPSLLASCIARSSSWSDVIAHLIAERDDLRATVHQAEPAEQRGPGRGEAMQSLAEIVARVVS